MTNRSIRFNFSDINPDKIKKTPQGGIKLQGVVLKEGVFVYFNEDGSEVREWVPKESILNEESLMTLEGAPITNEHPEQMISPKNWKNNSIGFVQKVMIEDEKYVVADIIINDQKTIDDIGSGKKRELSAGYWAKTLNKSGRTPDGERYDKIQTELFFNHCSVVEIGRCGSDVSLRLNSKGNQTTEYMKNNRKSVNDGLFNDRNKPQIGSSNIMTKKNKDQETKVETPELTNEEMVELKEASDNLKKLNSFLEKLEIKAEDFFTGADEKAEKIKAVLNGEEVAKTNEDELEEMIQAEASRRIDLLVAARELGVEGITGKESTPELQLQIVKTSKPHLELEGRTQEALDVLLEDSLSGVDINAFWAKPSVEGEQVEEVVENSKEPKPIAKKKSGSNLDALLNKVRTNSNDTEDAKQTLSVEDEIESFMKSQGTNFHRYLNRG